MKYTATINKTNENTNALFTTKGLRYISDEAAAELKKFQDRIVENNRLFNAAYKEITDPFFPRLQAAANSEEFAKIWNDCQAAVAAAHLDEKYPTPSDESVFEIE